MASSISYSALSFSPNYSIPRVTPPNENEEKDDSLSRRNVKLSTTEVFDKIRPLICSIYSSMGESSGFFISLKGTTAILTAAHNIPIENRDGRGQFTTDFIQVNYDRTNTPYFPTSFPGLVQEHARILDLYAMKIELEAKTSPVLPNHVQLKEGMKVYFAGYPLGQDTVTFHKGTISSISENQGIRRFTIDGTVVPGNSGSPVVIQCEGNLSHSR